ncbi:unnamed protein product [Mytilus edulis]|uniref:Uncharacterized protein n=1 Tax=Mytilus edulis TaxID=6550 RepID=A0A8S3V632_MYTED|nr:unnamed protein product [Mytilus edulis]
MASNVSVCGICDFRHVTKPSVVWCSNAMKGYVMTVKNTTVFPNHHFSKFPSLAENIIKGSKYSVKKHDCPCCKKCVIEVYNECKDFVDIDDIIKNVKSSNAFQEIEHTLSDIADYMQRVKQNREENLISIKEQKEQIETKILKAREAINNHLDFLQHNLIEALNLTIDKQNKDIYQFLKLVEKNKKDIEEFQSNHLKIKQHTSELQTFLTLKQMERDIATKEEFIQSISKSNLTNDVKRFGEVVTETKPNNIPFVRQKDKQAAQSLIPVPTKSIDDLKLTLVQSLNTLSRSIRGCAMLTDGKMVFTCYIPGYVTVVNPDGSKYCEIKTGNDFDVIYLGDNSIAVTSCYNSNHIHLIDIKLKTIKKSLNVGSSNDGIALYDKDLIYCARAQGLKKIS